MGTKEGEIVAGLHIIRTRCLVIADLRRMPQILGSMAIEWEEMLPPVPEEIWRADYRAVARRLATHDGKALV